MNRKLGYSIFTGLALYVSNIKAKQWTKSTRHGKRILKEWWKNENNRGDEEGKRKKHEKKGKRKKIKRKEEL